MGRAGIVSEPPNDSIIQNALHRVRARRKNNVRLLMYVLEHAASQDWFSILCNRSTIAHFTGEKFSSLRVPLPPSSEQTAMADFLDRETGRIDTLVAKKQALIERLKEKRTALISRTVTRGLPPDEASKAGLDPFPRLKPSDVEWLGDVPEGWEIGRTGGVFRFISGGTPSTTHEAYWNGNIPWVSSKDMKHFRVTDTIDHVTMQAVNESATSMLPAGSVLLVVRSGILRHTIPIAVAKCGVAINQDIKGLQPSTERINSLFFSYWVLGNQRTLLTLWRQQGATVESLNVDAVKVTPFPLPPIDEQTAIADFLDRETAKIDRLIAKIETAIERLREYRTALITAAVTGKIDVRDICSGTVRRAAIPYGAYFQQGDQ